jgi:inhibitor of KinA
MTYELRYSIFPLGDSAITVDFGNIIDETINRQVMALFYQLQNHPLKGMIEAIPAYSSLTIYYDAFQLRKTIVINKTVYQWMEEHLKKRLEKILLNNDIETATITIPVCYEKEFALDIEEIATVKNISVNELIEIHTSKTYGVYMLGFLPGFAYMGEVDKKLEMPRKQQPRQKVEAGSVGITGKQTGIYPLSSPGGWQIIGRTPLKLFDAGKKEPTLLKAGDKVKFISISKDEFESY